MRSTTSVDTDRRARRADRYDAQRVVWAITRQQRLAYCGRALSTHRSDVLGPFTDWVALRRSETPEGARGGFSGLQTCGSVWSCPVCSERINAERQGDLETGIGNWIDGGGAVVFGTLTLRHKTGDALADLWDAIGPAWNRVTSGAGVAWNGSKRAGGDVGDKARYGIKGYVRIVEVKHGANGWHPHIHFLLFLDRYLEKTELDALEGRLFARWLAALTKSGYDALRDVGIDLRPCGKGEVAERLSEYLSKNLYTATTPERIAYELAGSQSKRLGKGGRTPFEMLADVEALRRLVDVKTGEIKDLDAIVRSGVDLHDLAVEHDRTLRLWLEWEKASHGRLQMTWSRGMRDLLDLGRERTDEEIAEDDALRGEVVGGIAADTWKALRCFDRRATILDALELGGWPAVVDLLSRWSSARGAPPPVLTDASGRIASVQPVA